MDSQRGGGKRPLPVLAHIDIDSDIPETDFPGQTFGEIDEYEELPIEGKTWFM